MRDHGKAQPRIGGSEISALFGLNDYLDERALWMRKKDPIPWDEPNDRMRLGKHLERGIAEYYADLEGVEIDWCDITSQHPVYEFMCYTPDALVRGKRRGMDCKLVGWDQSYRWRHGPTDHSQMQAWWYMAALDYDEWDVVPLIMGEDRPRVYRVKRDAAVERIMLRKAESWWRRYLVGDERPPITGSDLSSAWLKHTYPKHRANTLDIADDEEAALLTEYGQIRRCYRRYEADKKLWENRIKEALGEREGLRWPGGKLTWKKTRDSHVVEWEPLAEALLARHPEGDRLREDFTVTKPGHRRIHFKPVDGEEEELG